MARSHYVMDLFYPATDGSDRLRREVLRIESENDEAALAEGQRIDGWRKTEFYQIRAIHNSSRAGDKVIFSSQVEEPPADTTIDVRDERVVIPETTAGATVAEPDAAEPLAAAGRRSAKADE